MILMKKKLFIFIILMVQFPIFAQEKSPSLDIPVDETTGMIVYREVVVEEGSKKELFNRASEWLHQFFANPIHVTKVRDAASGVIKGKHQFRLINTNKDGSETKSAVILYSFKIEAKDARYRYTVDNFLLKRESRYPAEKWLDKSDPSYNPQWNEYLKQIDRYVKEEFTPNLKEGMKPKPEKVEEEW